MLGVTLLRALYRARDVVALPGQLRQAYVRCWRDLPSPYDVCSDDDGAFVYGEAFVVVARALLKKHGAAEGSHVVDLGAGRGNVVLAARSLGAAASGYELVRGHVDVVEAVVRVVGGSVVCADARDVDLAAVAGVSHVWCSWATWPSEDRRAVVQRLRALPSGAVVFGVVHGVDDAAFEVVDDVRAAFSWGFADVVVSRRR